MSETELNDFTWWENAVAGHEQGIDANTPQSGFYKVRRKGRNGFVPCAFWYDTKTGELRCHMDGSDFDLQRALEIWPYAAKNPVSREDYVARFKEGKWPGEHAAVVGHNAAPPDDTPEAIGERIDDLAREAEKMIAAGAAGDDATSDQASDLANTFGELEGKIGELHKQEKQPHLDAGRVVDRKWFSLRDRAVDLKRRLKLVVVTPWLNKKSDEAEKANVAAISAGAAPESLPQQRLTAGASKRSTALRTHKRAEILDKSLLLSNLIDHPEIIALAQKIADGAARNGIALPGTKIVLERSAA